MLATKPAVAPRENAAKRRIRFQDHLEVALFDSILANDIPTKIFMGVVRKNGNLVREAVTFDAPVEVPKGQEFLEIWDEQAREYAGTVRRVDLELFRRLSEADGLLDDAQLERLSDLEGEFFGTLMDLREVLRRYEDNSLLSGFRLSALEGAWHVCEEILTTLEKEWSCFETCEFEKGSAEDPEQLPEKFSLKLVNSLTTAALRSMKLPKAELDKVKVDFLDRWEEYTRFLNQPLTVFNEFREELVTKYFKLIDSGIICALINDVRVKPKGAEVPSSEMLVERLCHWKVPKSLLSESKLRTVHAPLVAADKAFSCNHSPTESCRDHPGKLLLLLIRLNHLEMVRFALDNGMSVNTCSNYGQCKKLQWVTESASVFADLSPEDELSLMHHHHQHQTHSHHVEVPEKRMSLVQKMASKINDGKVIPEVYEEAKFEEVDAAELKHAEQKAMEFLSLLKQKEALASSSSLGNEADYLKCTFDLVTPLSVAVENAVHGAGLKIVELLLNHKANPLLCADAAVKCCVNALDSTSTATATPSAKKCLTLIYTLVHTDYKKVKKNHCTRILLYQAAIERRWDAVRFIAKGSEDVNGELRLGFDLEQLELLLSCVDHLLNDGLQKVYPTYGMCLVPLLFILEEFELVLNNWRSLQLYRIIKLAMQDGLPGDRFCVVNMLGNSIVKNYLGIERNPEIERRKLENLPIPEHLRSKYRLEHRRENSNSSAATMLSTRRSLDRKDRGKEAKVELKVSFATESVTSGEMEIREKVEKLLKLAVRMESMPIIEEILAHSFVPSDDCKFHMLAMAVKAQNTTMLEYLYAKVGKTSFLNKSFIIALKGKFHQSLQKIFDLGFKLNLSNVRGAKRTRATLNLFLRCLEDVLFERTMFDRGNGTRNKEGFTRQDEEATFSLLIAFLVRSLDEDNLKTLVKTIVTRAIEEYENRIWFYGFHEMLVCLAEERRCEGIVDDDFVQVYGMNYTQWLLYSKDLSKKFDRAKKVNSRRKWKERRGMLKEKRMVKKTKKKDSDSSVESDEKKSDNELDSEVFLQLAKNKIETSLAVIFERRHEVSELQDLYEEIQRGNEVGRESQQLMRTQRDMVDPLARRNGSRNFDYLIIHAMANGTSEML